MTEHDLRQIDRGSVIAPAGCWKTHLITEAVRDHLGTKPILVLTHTNAGVAALQQRLKRMEVPTSNYKLATIDGWAMRLVNTFPHRAAYTDGPTAYFCTDTTAAELQKY